MADCIFCNISQGKTHSEILYSDDRCFVIRDIHPAAPTHLLIIPHDHITSLAGLDEGCEAMVGHLLTVAGQMAQREGVAPKGYRLIVNQGANAGQAIEHLHMHLLGGKRLGALG